MSTIKIEATLDRLSALVERIAKALRSCGYVVTAEIPLQQKGTFAYCKHNNKWGFYILDDQGVLPFSSASILVREEAATLIPVMLRTLEARAQEQESRLGALCEMLGDIARSLEHPST